MVALPLFMLLLETLAVNHWCSLRETPEFPQIPWYSPDDSLVGGLVANV